jgi:5-methylcytosine-specific restriction endonuclease McrA
VSREFLAEYPACVLCGQPAKVVDHITPHRGDEALFWDKSNWQPLCWKHHSAKTLEENNFFREGGEK